MHQGTVCQENRGDPAAARTARTGEHPAGGAGGGAGAGGGRCGGEGGALSELVRLVDRYAGAYETAAGICWAACAGSVVLTTGLLELGARSLARSVKRRPAGEGGPERAV
ncbi:hypothetical protein LO771_14640 [Streptacidiphilus sp. ASG 303]|uniref:hypothetical protein n=1 Tax=Streptacidiphilus sp. ASG 303 TaxID=2896847 RepID=UPI001E2FA294|nr:hypothetical protein [Streptacidiphilus sp. ASG 303]MCD0483598.1 hypothetical protein [Streptacidiphilus sp. ASG 303]